MLNYISNNSARVVNLSFIFTIENNQFLCETAILNKIHEKKPSNFLLT